MSEISVINLSNAPGERAAWGRPSWQVYTWSVAELILVTNPWQISSRIRVMTLRAFGAKIGADVIFRPRTRVKFPWKLEVGDRSWIGEGVWIHNQDLVTIGSDVVVSQETFISTGSHRHRTDMALVTKPIILEDGVWITSRCMITGGVRVGANALVRPLTLVDKDVPENVVAGTEGIRWFGKRFRTKDPEHGE